MLKTMDEEADFCSRTKAPDGGGAIRGQRRPIALANQARHPVKA
jgi:hypothetical protein